MSSLQDARAKLASHFSNGTSDDGNKWAQLWDQGDFLPWDRNAPNPALEDTLANRQDVIGSPVLQNSSGNHKRKRALVPGCGRGYDVLLLASFGYDATGLEVSETAVKRCWEEKEKNGDKYPVRDQEVGAGQVSFVHGDFFKSEWLQTDAEGNVPVCPPEKSRPAWAERTSQLLSETGRLICVEFPSTKDPKLGGPPFALPSSVYVEHLSHPGEALPYNKETGRVVEDSSTLKNAAALKQIARWQPPQTHEIGMSSDGKVLDWVSVWQH